MSTHNLCFEQKYEKYQSFSSENLQFLEVKFSIYLNRRVFLMLFLIFINDLPDNINSTVHRIFTNDCTEILLDDLKTNRYSKVI